MVLVPPPYLVRWRCMLCGLYYLAVEDQGEICDACRSHAAEEEKIKLQARRDKESLHREACREWRLEYARAYHKTHTHSN